MFSERLYLFTIQQVLYDEFGRKKKYQTNGEGLSTGYGHGLS
jgi:hypothetical protein